MSASRVILFHVTLIYVALVVGSSTGVSMLVGILSVNITIGMDGSPAPTLFTAVTMIS